MADTRRVSISPDFHSARPSYRSSGYVFGEQTA